MVRAANAFRVRLVPLLAAAIELERFGATWSARGKGMLFIAESWEEVALLLFGRAPPEHLNALLE